MAKPGRERGRDGLEVLVMCDVPSNVSLAEGFASRCDGLSTGWNDMIQVILGGATRARPRGCCANMTGGDREAPPVIAAAGKTGGCAGSGPEMPRDSPVCLWPPGSIPVTPDPFLAVRAIRLWKVWPRALTRVGGALRTARVQPGLESGR